MLRQCGDLVKLERKRSAVGCQQRLLVVDVVGAGHGSSLIDRRVLLIAHSSMVGEKVRCVNAYAPRTTTASA